MEIVDENSTSHFPSTPIQTMSWLQRLKDESWEAELLVSAIAIFGTFQLFKGINWAINLFIDILPPNQYLAGYAICFLGLLAVSILASMFVIHFFLRAYWVGLVGLNSVFPDYSLEDSVYSKIYTEKMLSVLPKLEDSIKKVDELCSVIFSAAFTILLIYAYMAIFMSLYLLLYNLLIPYIPGYILLIPFIIVLAATFISSFFGIYANLKKNKENQRIQNIYFQFVTRISMITLGPLYKNILQVIMIFSSNFKSKKSMIWLILIFLFSGIILCVHQIGKTNLFYLVRTDYFFDEFKTYAGYYRSENKDIDFLISPEIDADLIQSKVLKLFIPIFSHEHKKQDVFCGTIEKDKNLSKVEQLKKLRTEKIDCYTKYNLVYLNDEAIKPEFLRYVHPKTGQFGIVCFIKLPPLLEGTNRLNIKKIFNKELFYQWSIPFYYLPEDEVNSIQKL